MRIYVFSARRLIACLAVFISSLVILLSAYIGENGVSAVFSVQKELPVYSVDVGEKLAAITFDCAWGADDIPGILETLKEADVRATFFIVGQWAEKNPDAVRMMAQDGHDVANHSYSHFRMGSLGRERISSEIARCGELLEELSGRRCELFRAPYGDYSNAVVSEARRLGYFTIQWDVDSLDWKPGIAKEEILGRIKTKVKPGSIILFHNDTPHTAELLPGIISGLKSSGYSLVPVSKLILREDYYIDHEGRQRKIT